MLNGTLNPAVDFYFRKAGKWQEAVEQLRTILLHTGLTEELKWGVPCYTFQHRNIVLIHDFKDYCALLFFKGALLRDESGILVQQTKNVQSARQIRFTNVQDVLAQEPIIKAYVYEAIEVEKAGLKVAYKKPEELSHPEELQTRLKGDPALKTAFEALTPGRKRA